MVWWLCSFCFSVGFIRSFNLKWHSFNPSFANFSYFTFIVYLFAIWIHLEYFFRIFYQKLESIYLDIHLIFFKNMPYPTTKVYECAGIIHQTNVLFLRLNWYNRKY
jgi:hypothetical protein